MNCMISYTATTFSPRAEDHSNGSTEARPSTMALVKYLMEN